MVLRFFKKKIKRFELRTGVVCGVQFFRRMFRKEGRIENDPIKFLVGRERSKKIAVPHFQRHAVRSRIAARQCHGLRIAIHREHVRAVLRGGDADHAAARAQIQHAPAAQRQLRHILCEQLAAKMLAGMKDLRMRLQNDLLDLNQTRAAIRRKLPCAP